MFDKRDRVLLVGDGSGSDDVCTVAFKGLDDQGSVCGLEVARECSIGNSGDGLAGEYVLALFDAIAYAG